MALVERQNVPYAVTRRQHYERGIGKADLQSGIAFDDCTGSLYVCGAERLQLIGTSGDLFEKCSLRAVAYMPGEEIVELGEHEW